MFSLLVPGRSPPILLSTLFDLALPFIDCETDFRCYAIFEGTRKEYFHDVALSGGAFIKLFAWQNLEDNDSTSCGSIGYEAAFDQDTDDETWTDGTSMQAGVTDDRVEGILPRGGSDEGSMDQTSLMQLSADFAPATGGNTATPALPPGDNTATLGQGDDDLTKIVFIGSEIGQEADTLLQQVRQLEIRHNIRIKAVQVWVAVYLHELLWMPSRVLVDETGSLTSRTWQALRVRADGQDLGLVREETNEAVFRDPLFPNLVGTTRDLLRLGYRVYMLDHNFDPIRHTHAILSTGKESAKDIIARTGYGERCIRLVCFLLRVQNGVTKTWQYLDVVDELHGASFLVRHVQSQVCDSSVLDESSEVRGHFGQSDETLFLQSPIMTQDVEGTGLFQLLQRSYVVDDAEAIHIEDYAMVMRQEQAEWRALVRRAVSRTVIVNYDFVEPEMRFLRGATGYYPPIRFYGADFRLARTVLFLHQNFDLEKSNLVYKIRRFLEPEVHIRDRLYLSFVKPMPTPVQQTETEAICVLVGRVVEPDHRMALVVALGVRPGIAPVLKGYRLPSRITTAQLLRRLTLQDFCQTEMFRCRVSYDQQELPNLVAWQVIEGMRIDLQVIDLREQCDFDMTRRLSLDTRLETEEMTLLQSGRAFDLDEIDDTWKAGMEESALMQTNVAGMFDIGRSAISLRHLEFCSEERISWIMPLRIHSNEAYPAERECSFDYVLEHYLRHGFQFGRLEISGWLFQTSDQVFGRPYVWGLHDATSWSKQLSSLARGLQIGDVILYSVIPPLPDVIGTQRQHVTQLLVPYANFRHAPLLLVVEHALHPPRVRRAVHCIEPCFVDRLFRLLGLAEWCDDEHVCTVTFVHGVCRRDFFDHDVIVLPMASLVRLTVQNRPLRVCETERRHSVSDHRDVARHVASMVHPIGSSAYRRTVGQALGVLQHASGSDAGEIDDHMLMQVHMASSSSGAEQERVESAEQSSTESPGPPSSWPIVVSSASSGPPALHPVCNHEYDWVLTWGRVRRCLTEYDRHWPRRVQPNTVLVNIIAYHAGGTDRFEGLCPNWMLTEECSICLLSDWFQEMTFPLFREYSRAFPTQVELIQNTPTIMVVQEMPADRVPIVIQLYATDLVLHHIYMAFQFERIACIEDWIQQRTRLFRPYDMTLDGQLVHGYQDVRLSPGSVIVFAFHSDLQMQQPQSSTTWTGSLLNVVTHDTWEAESVLDQSVLPEGEYNPEEEENTLEPRRQLGLMQSDSDFTGFLQLEVCKFRKKGRESGNTATLQTGQSRMDMAAWKGRVNNLLVDQRPQACYDHHDGYWWRERYWREAIFCLSPVQGLPPPGNTTSHRICWISQNMWLMDDWVTDGGIEYVFDFGFPVLQLHSLFQQSQPRQTLLLANHLPEQVGSSPKQLVLSDLLREKEIKMPAFDSVLRLLEMPTSLDSHDWATILKDLPEPIRQQFLTLRIDAPQELERIEIYTDGSVIKGHTEGEAAWAFAVMGYEGDDIYLIAMEWGTVTTDPMADGWTGALHSDIKAAEAQALIRAIEWTFCCQFDVLKRFFFDSLLAGYSAAGRYQVNDTDKQYRLLRSLAMAAEAYARQDTKLEWNHVKAHSGVLGNELVDTLAKQAFLGQTEHATRARPDYTPFLFGKRLGIESFWFWLTCQISKGSAALPCVRNESVFTTGLHSRPDLAQCLPDSILRHGQESSHFRYGHFSLFVCSYNAATLGQKAGGVYVRFLREQAWAHQLDILFLQETRSKESQMVLSQTHIRLVSASAKGVGGLETWLRRAGGQKEMKGFEVQETQVLLSEPEIFLVKARLRSVTLLLLNAHAPHSGHTETEIRVFWDRLSASVLPYVARFPNLVVGIDANAHFDVPNEPLVGHHGLEERSNSNASWFQLFLHKARLCLPSTFAAFHEGPTETWHSHANGRWARCDYIAVPQDWMQGHLKSYVLNSLDEGKRAIDHFPVALEIKVRTLLKYVHRKRASFDRIALQRADEATVSKLLSDVRVPDWQTDINQHAQSLSQQILGKLCEAFPMGPGQAHQTYISEDTWAIRKERLRVRAEISRVKQETGNFSLQYAFSSWYVGLGGFRVDFVSFFTLFARIRTLQIRSHELAKQLTKHLRHDRTDALERLAKQAGQLSPKDFMAALRGVGVQNKKKPSGIRPLPHLLNAQGHPVETVEEMAAVWRKYFGDQEDGLETDFTTLFDKADSTDLGQGPVPEWDEIPTRSQIEAQFRRTATGKAYFADQIPGDLLAKAPQQLAGLYYTFFCKEVLFVKEAMIHKGGYLAAAHKKGNPCEMSNYRSLFVSSVIGKTLHSLMRKDIVHYFGHQRLPLQVGGLPGQGITQPVHSLHLFHQRALMKGWSVGILFIDISNAFYRLVRQHITHVDKDCRSIRDLFDQLHLPEGSFEDFQCSLQQRPAIASSGASPHLQAMFKEFYDLTWFVVKHDNCVVQTRRGSRPGDALADICFSYALTRILKGPLAKLTQLFPGHSAAVEWTK